MIIFKRDILIYIYIYIYVLLNHIVTIMNIKHTLIVHGTILSLVQSHTKLKLKKHNIQLTNFSIVTVVTNYDFVVLLKKL